MDKLDDKVKDFMLYVLFGLKYQTAAFEELTKKEELFKICAKRAYRDLSRTLNYTLSSSELYSNVKKSSYSKEEKKDYIDLKESFKEKICDLIKEKTGVLLSCKDQEKFDAEHTNVCNDIIDFANEDKPNKTEEMKLFKDNEFYYGHAQKWLNMTLKNILLISLFTGREDIWAAGDKSKLISFFHVPVDSLIIEAVWEELDKDERFAKTRKKDSGFGGEKKAWSTWDGPKNEPATYFEDADTDYSNFQMCIRKAIEKKEIIKGTLYNCPIEWEFDAWIRTSMNREIKRYT